jgi:hypothetical protein
MPRGHPFDLALFRDHGCLLHLLYLLQEEFHLGLQALLVLLELDHLLPKLFQLLSLRYFGLILHGSKTRELCLKLLDAGCGGSEGGREV